MKLIIQQSSDITDIQITIKCSYITKELQNVITLINNLESSVTGYKEDSCYKISIESICFIDAIDNKTFLYTNNNIYSCKEKLYELEEKLKNMEFIRINKNTIVNLRQISHVKSIGISKLEVNLKNREKLIVNRSYLQNFKNKFVL
nr:LytTR family DNA-binding domain-containing protein [uncultured Clostridium sp.]